MNLQHIRVNDIPGPLVVLFGPRNIGKTVTLVRVRNYINTTTYEIRPNESFRVDKEEYKKTIKAFEAVTQTPHFAPAATGNIDFLLLDVTHKGEKFCQILEAPGEHFFDTENPNKEYPAYFNQILNSYYRKIFVFFFELSMFDSDQDRKNYTDKIARLVSQRILSTRDRIIIVCNKCDLYDNLYRGGKPIESQYQQALYNKESFNKLKDVLSQSNFGKVPFVPFSAGSFTSDGTGRLAFAPSGEEYPRNLWNKIRECVDNKPWWWPF